jgi:uncharacterized membrane protein YfcA
MLFFLAATLYASVGHAGASAYLAVMALLGAAPHSMKPTALVLNLCVATIATAQFARARALPWRVLLPCLVGSVPTAFIAARFPVSAPVLKGLIGLSLLAAALRLVWQIRASTDDVAYSEPRATSAACAGAIIGVFAGLTGTGGGVFLTPLVLFRRWTAARPAAGLSAGFILANSIAGILGNVSSLANLRADIPVLAVSVVVGGIVGSTLGVRLYARRELHMALACVLVVAAAKLLLI